jgi:tetratricopeptide (TPR) repeat protein
VAGTNSLELEIHNYFQEGTSTEFVSRELVAKYEKMEVLSPSEIEGISHFLITCGRFDLLKKLYEKCVARGKIGLFPTGFLIEALIKQNKPITDRAMSVCEDIIEKQPFEATALQNSQVKSFSVQVAKELKEIQKNYTEERLRQKTRLIEQLNHFRTAQLQEQEELVLQQLTKFYPQDLEIGLLKQAHLEKKADDILARVISKRVFVKPKTSIDKSTTTDEFLKEMHANILKIANDLVTQQPDQLYNLAILAFQFELFEACLNVLEKAPETPARDWLRAEALLEAGKYLELIHLVEYLEGKESHSTDTVFAVTYLKAIAYHGLGNKDLAIRLMEGILQVVPYYRSAEALLVEWQS